MTGLAVHKTKKALSQLKRLKSDESGFTLVELLIVMIIVAVLAGIAIMSLTGSDEGAQITSMISDARAAIAAEQAYYMAYRDYVDVDVDASSNDEAQRAQLGSSDIYVVASPHNHVQVTKTTCTSGQPGFTVTVTSSKASGKQVTFDSCNDAGIKTGTTGGGP